MKNKKIVLVILSLLFVFSLAACGKSGKAEDPNIGTYVLTDEKFTDGSGKISQEWTITLNADGTGKASRSVESDVTWSVDGEALKLTEKMMGIKLDYEGTIKDGVIQLMDGNTRMYVFTKEGQDPAMVPESFFENH